MAKLGSEIGGTVFSRRRWRTPWSSGTSGEPSAGTPTVIVIPPGMTAPAGSGTAPGGAGEPGAPWSRPGGARGPTESPGSPGFGDPPSTRVIRIPASVGIGQAAESAPAFGGAEAAGQRSRSALTTRDAQSAEAPAWERAGSERYGRIALAVIAVATVCALLAVLAALAATVGGGTSSGPAPAASIPPGPPPASQARDTASPRSAARSQCPEQQRCQQQETGRGLSGGRRS